MRSIRLSFEQMVKCLLRDVMLLVVCAAPVLMGIFFKYAIPAAEHALTGYLKKEALFAPYYELFDIFFAMITAILFSYVAAMIVLEERDEKTAAYLSITPLQRNGYIISRFAIPGMIAIAVALCLFPLFRLTQITGVRLIYLAIAAGLQGLMTALCVITFSSNKLEGMAVTKLSSLLGMAVIVPYFVESKVQYVLAVLPSLWIGKAVKEQDAGYGVLSLVLVCIWLALLFRRYLRQGNLRNL